MKNTQQIKTCTVCGSEYKVKAYKFESSKYCSKSCWEKRNPKTTAQCEYCGKDFSAYKSQEKRFCSLSCSFLWRSKHLIGDKSPNWKGGVSLIRERARAGGDVAKWRIAVYERDNYTCQKCGSKKDLNAHHIKHVSTHPELITDIDNGITLCVDCHGEEHGKVFRVRAKYPKTCQDCGQQTKGRSYYCHSCSTKRQHQRMKNQAS